MIAEAQKSEEAGRNMAGRLSAYASVVNSISGWNFFVDFSSCLHLALVTALCDVPIHFHQSNCPFCSAIKVISSKLAGGLNSDGFYCSRLSILKQKNITMDHLYVLSAFLFNLDV